MNKLLVVLLAVCLVSVHAGIVKQETVTENTNSMGENIIRLAEKLKEELSKSVDVEKIKDDLAKTFNPDKIKSDFNALVDQVNEAAKSLAPKAEAPKA